MASKELERVWLDPEFLNNLKATSVLRKHADGVEYVRADLFKDLGAMALALERKDKQIEALEQELARVNGLGFAEYLTERRKRDCVEFCQWFWNQPGTNAEQGYDEWRASLDKDG